MKTLKQILSDKEFEYELINPDDDTPIEVVIESVKIWLKQKQQSIKPKGRTSQLMYYYNGQSKILEELLSELGEDSQKEEELKK